MIVHQQPFVKTVARSLRDDCGLRGGERVVVAVSGGADSVALLAALAALAQRRHWALDLHVVHVQHHLRSEAEPDAAFVARLAETLALPYHRRDIAPADQPGNLEAAARRLRYGALAEVAGQIDADAIATAHQADDQLETLLMRLVRGASVSGLGGIAPARRLGRMRLIRPMLGVTHRQAIDFLDALGQRWREDRTNADRSRWRAKLRHEVLPVLVALRADAPIKAGQTAARLRQIAARLRRQARAYRARYVRITADQTARLDRRVARRTAPALLGEVIRRCAIDQGASADRLPARLIDAIVIAARDPSGQTRHFTLTHNVTITVAGQAVTWQRAVT